MNQENTEVRSKVIGVVGLNGSGKDALLKHLKERCGLEILSLGDVARELAHLEEVPSSRSRLHEISQKYTERYGEDFFIKALLEEIRNKSLQKVGITGIRKSSEIEFLRRHFGANFFLIHVQVDNPKLRFERFKKKAKARDPKNYEEFLAQDKAEKDLFQIDEAMQRADATISNNGTLEDFYREIDKLISQQQFFQSLSCGSQ